MNGFRSAKFSAVLATIALALGAGLLFSSQASAGVASTVSVGSASVAVGGQGTVSLEALNMEDPGLGAWSIDIQYDPDVVTAVACTAEQGGVCNAAYDTDLVRITGASAGGLLGDTTLGSVTFRCDEQGASLLTPILVTFADGTPGDPQDIDAVADGGSISCQPAAGPTVKIGSASILVGEQGAVNLDALDIAAPGLGAWTVDVTYDPEVLTALSCAPLVANVCNAEFAADSSRATGANAGGLEGDTTLAGITFRCDVVGSSTLTLTLQVFVNANVADPQVINAATVNGSITCSAATVEPTATPTSTTDGLPTAGTGGPGWDGGGPLSWLIAGLAGAGIAWLIAGLAGAGFAPAGGDGAPRQYTPRDSNTILRQERPNSGSSSTPNWFTMARADLGGKSLADIAGFRSSRKR